MAWPVLPASAARLKWSFSAPDHLDAPAIGPDGTIYVVSYNTTLYALLPDGKQKWTFDPHERIDGIAIARDGTIYLNGASLIALSPSGIVKWTRKITGSSFLPPAFGPDGTIYVPAGDYLLYAMTPDGKIKWRFEPKSHAWTPLTVGPDGTVYVSALYSDAKDGRYAPDGLYAIDRDGRLKWRLPNAENEYLSPSIDEETLYVGGGDGIFAFSRSGKLQWKYPPKGTIGVDNPPAVGSDGSIYFIADDTVYAINRRGTLRWRFITRESSDVSPVIAPDGLIYLSVNESITALTPTGNFAWIIHADDTPSTPVIGSNGTIYASAGAELLAIDPGPPGRYRVARLRHTVDPGAVFRRANSRLGQIPHVNQIGLAISGSLTFNGTLNVSGNPLNGGPGLPQSKEVAEPPRITIVVDADVSQDDLPKFAAKFPRVFEGIPIEVIQGLEDGAPYSITPP